MIIDGLANAITNLILFIIMVIFVKYLQLIRTPTAWINVKKHDIKLFFLGIISAFFYKSIVGLIRIKSGTMILTINQTSIINTLIFALLSSFGFLGVALFEEGLFRGYIMQVILRRMPRLLAIVIQAVAFGLIHY